MGLLTQGSPLNWEETKNYADHVRKHGIIQFLNIYNKAKDRQNDDLKWGDEVEYMLVAMDHNNHKVRLVLSGGDVLHSLQEKGENTNPNHPTLWRPEYGSYMIEGTPGQPYGGTMSEFNTVEDNMGKRRREASSLLKENQTLCTITAFPRLGCPGFTFPEFDPKPVEEGMALSAASPFYRGYVSDNDCRWGVISASVDDRTREERGLEPLKHNKYRISKSRYDSIDSYLSSCGEKYNDIELTIDEEINKQLLEAGVDRLVAQHVAHLFIRDPLLVLEETIHQDDENESEHFESIQSSNWQTMRFKPPPPNSDIGWRVEFRPMDVQLTDFENSAYVVFVVLLTRVILSYKLDFLIPLSKEGVFHGLIPILNCYLENMEVDVETRCTILNYFKLIKKRASGELMTMARWMREFVANHPEYKQDSVITDKINYDLIVKCDQIANGAARCPELLGDPVNRAK
ncbi:Glutamate--cysteine ligase catalytic subunit [Acipenser ruthenus]|uniref:Glutamate--cysteine ligase n=1 Tax=Acipenser ruthenus TaxID=7906 RepID=A0A444UD66_ACIRT|nr:Glutamate--cysteine ligase catalytic subunit [Acipenser ruthenus]